jgi:crotonobetainyl-CoA:carnitine CoA-transferase CaiB-like acyl-CoA transferase
MEGVKVVELAIWAAAPGGGAILADWGAEVVKVEDPNGGDPFRAFLSLGVGAAITSINGVFESDNRNKKSIAVDIRTQEGQEIVYRLVEQADVFLTNFRPAAIERYCMGYPIIKARNPRIVYVGLTGYGHTGPEKDRAAYDYAGFWARSGIMASMGEPGTPPPSQRPGMGDHTTSIAVVAATSAALFARERTGVGQEVRLSLFRTGMWVDSMDIQTALLTRQDITRLSRKSVGNPLFNAYRTKDNKWLYLVMLQSDRHWPVFCQVIGKEDLPQDPRFVDAAARRENGSTLVAIIDAVLENKTRAEWARILDEAGIFWGPVQTVEDVIHDPQARENGAFVPLDHPSGERMELVASPIDFSETPASVRHAAPELGQHTEEVLLAAGYAWEDLAGLREKGIIT